MGPLTVSAKGQVTLSQDLLKHLGVQPGEKISVDKLPDGRIEIKAVRSAGKISDFFNLLKKKGDPSLSIEEINEITRLKPATSPISALKGIVKKPRKRVTVEDMNKSIRRHAGR